LPITKATPTEIVTMKTAVRSALPAMTIELRVRRLARRDGSGTSSGCSAARGLRGAIGLGSPSSALTSIGGYGSPAPGTARGFGGGSGGACDSPDRACPVVGPAVVG
jgi:hypothetical protein